MKKIAIMLVTLVLAISINQIVFADTNAGMSNFKQIRTYTENQFVDVSENEWFTKNVKTAYEFGLVNGTSEITFNPTSDITIAETITLASRLYSTYVGDNHKFESLSPWYQSYVGYAIENNIITTEQYDDYNAYATRSQFVLIIANAFPQNEFDEINNYPRGYIPDVDIDAEYADAVYLLYNSGVLAGNDVVGTFYPNNTIKRSEVAAILTRMVDKTLRIKRNLPASLVEAAVKSAGYYEKFRNSFKTGAELLPGTVDTSIEAVYYVGDLKCADFLEEFSFGSSNWRKAAEKYATEVVRAQNSKATQILFRWTKEDFGNRISSSIYLGYITYNEMNDEFYHYWDSAEKIKSQDNFYYIPEDADLNDTTGPEITILSISPNPAKLGEKITVRAKITDDNGVRNADVQLCNSVGNVAGGALKLVEGDSKDGIYEGTFSLPSRTPVGSWEANIYAYDVLGNSGLSWGDSKEHFTVKA